MDRRTFFKNLALAPWIVLATQMVDSVIEDRKYKFVGYIDARLNGTFARTAKVVDWKTGEKIDSVVWADDRNEIYGQIDLKEPFGIKTHKRKIKILHVEA